MIISPISIIPPPLRHGNGRPTSAKDGKTQDKQHRQRGTVPCRRDQVHVVFEDARAVVAQVPLAEEARERPGQEHAGLRLVVGDVARVLDELGEVDLVEGEFFDFRDELMRVSGD